MCYERKLQPNMDDVVFFGGEEEEEEEVDVAEKKYTAKKEKALNEEKRLVKLGLLYPANNVFIAESLVHKSR